MKVNATVEVLGNIYRHVLLSPVIHCDQARAHLTNLYSMKQLQKYFFFPLNGILV